MAQNTSIADCDCIFCKSKCPECGGVQVEIIYTPEFTLKNEEPNFLNIHHSGSRVKMSCQDCGEFFDENDIRLLDLKNALGRSLGIMDHRITIDGKGRMKVGHCLDQDPCTGRAH